MCAVVTIHIDNKSVCDKLQAIVDNELTEEDIWMQENSDLWSLVVRALGTKGHIYSNEVSGGQLFEVLILHQHLTLIFLKPSINGASEAYKL